MQPQKKKSTGKKSEGEVLARLVQNFLVADSRGKNKKEG